MSLLKVGVIPISSYDINNSLRFRASASAWLNRTPASASNRTTWTWSLWVKRGVLGAGANQRIFFAGANQENGDFFSFTTTDAIRFSRVDANAFTDELVTTQLFRDPSAWYHLVVAYDSTQATASNRVKLYVNGSEITSFSTANYPALNQNTYINSATPHYIGRAHNAADYFDGYMAEVNFVNAQALTPSSFGETNPVTGVWQPKAYTGTYGTNGFYQKYSNIALTSGSNTGLGQDFSGNGNFWNTNNISVTAGTTYDAMTDSPTLTSATVSNYCVLNTLDKGAGTVTNGSLTFTHTASTERNIRGTIGVSSGKFYWEAIPSGSAAQGIGIASSTATLVGMSGSTFIQYQETGQKSINNVRTAYGATYTSGDVIGVAFDADASSLVFYKNNVSQGAISVTSGLIYFPWIGGYNSTVNINFGQRPFTYTPPTGYNRLNTFNLPNSTIVKGNSYMDATTYTGTGASQSITNAAGFRPDFVWVKGRSGATDHALYDSVRGTTNDLVSNSTAAATTQAQGLTAFNSNGFTVGTLAKMNTNAATYVGWQWQAGQGSTSVISSGYNIAGTVSVNANAGFSIVTYTGNGGTGQTIPTGLNVTPSMIIAKSRSATSSWYVWHTNLTSVSHFMTLNGTAAQTNANTPWGGSIGSNYFTVTNNATNSVNVNAATYVAYCWAEIAGYSKFGSYTGNGSADGPFVYTGFRPEFVMIKNATTGGAGYNWNIFDSTRNSYNVVDLSLQPNIANAEFTEADLDFTANGFKLRVTNAGLNGNTNTLTYMAFAENPFKNSLAR